VARIVAQIRARWPRVAILLRADSGFARDELMAWCEANGVDYVFGLARNERLVGAIAQDLAAAEAEGLAHGGPARRFADFFWTTRDSWRRQRRVVAKAEHLPKGANPRFVVTSLPASASAARTLYEDVYCARGEVENRIKEQQLDLFADRTSAATMRANQLRLWFASFAYVLLAALRRVGLRHTQFAAATCGTIRLKLLKIGAQVRRSVAGSKSPCLPPRDDHRGRRWEPGKRPALTRPSITWPISTCSAPPSERPGIPPLLAPRAAPARPKSGSPSATSSPNAPTASPSPARQPNCRSRLPAVRNPLSSPMTSSGPGRVTKPANIAATFFRSSSASSYWSRSHSRTTAGATHGTPRICPSAIGWNTWHTCSAGTRTSSPALRCLTSPGWVRWKW
jgi:hypothetical protein